MGTESDGAISADAGEAGERLGTVVWQHDPDGIVTLLFDDPDASANTMQENYRQSMRAVVTRLRAERQQITGIVLASAKKTFFAGANLNALRDVQRANADEFKAFITEVRAQLRAIETLGVPVVAAINGAALGGGLEIALAAHHRIMLDDPKAVVGFPEVTLGILPGAGGVTRTVRMLGIGQALMGVLLQGQKRFRGQEAKQLGLIDEIVASREELVPAAKRWIAQRNATGQPTQQPWDADAKYKIPGGTPSTPAFAANLPAFPSNLRKQIKGANLPAPHHIMCAAVEGAQVDFDHALEIELRYFMDLVTGQVAKNMLQAFWFDLNSVNGNRGRPAKTEPHRVEKVVVLGAGMMGAAIAYVVANAGIDVVLKDVSLEAAQRGKQYSVALVEKALQRGRWSPAQAEELLARIHPTGQAADAAGAEVLIEAVYEDPGLKAQVYAEIERHLASDALLGSNTSTLPITELSTHVSRPDDFIGIHFFSPVDKMPLVELIRGARSSDATVSRALDFVKQIKKTPIVVNDSRGFFTSRVIGTFIDEGIAMLAEGIPPASIEQASSQAGYPAPVLQLSDELNLKLMRKIRLAAVHAADGSASGWDGSAAEVVINRMLDEFDRPGRLEGRGFYEYRDGKRIGLWPGLRDAFQPVEDPSALSLRDLQERMLFIEALEAVKCVDEGVIQSVADANIGSIFGIGYPPWTGGVLQYINGYAGGLTGFVARARELAAAYGERFEPPDSLVARAQRGERFSDEP
ncbi:MAG: 3-hydroxyacyl-CoA dehydrogenase NAD-binding domain-containing protein [Solirubrobacteraceae bacterium]